MKNLNLKNPDEAKRLIREMENMAGMPAYDLEGREDIRVNLRRDDSVGPARFKPDPLVPGGFVANELTLRAMRPDIFVLGESLDEFTSEHECACGQTIDLQFWKLCPYCAREVKT